MVVAQVRQRKEKEKKITAVNNQRKLTNWEQTDFSIPELSCMMV